MNELGDFSYLGVSRGAHCGASIVVQFAAQHCSSLCLQSEGDVFMAKNVTLLAVAAGPSSCPSLCKQSELQCCASVSYSAAPQRATMLAPQRATMLRILPTKKRYPKTSTAMEISGHPEACIWYFLFFASEERIPCWKERRLLLEELQSGGRNEALFNHEAEHVFVKPFVGHDEVALIARGGAP